MSETSRDINAPNPKTLALLLWLGAASLLFGAFVKITWELHEDSEFPKFDRTVLLFIEKLRYARLNGAAVDITALGSPTVIFLLTVIGLILLLLNKERGAALYLAIGSAGAGLWTYALKHLISRQRQSIVPRLVEVSGFSYPSGHSLGSSSFYLILTFLACRHYKTLKERMILFTASSLLIGGIAFSRLYLGVHYPSDVLSGIFLGASWAFFLTGLFISRI
jgi:undecaprenyl-diphosphatase